MTDQVQNDAPVESIENTELLNIETPEVQETEEQKQERLRDEQGRFVAAPNGLGDVTFNGTKTDLNDIAQGGDGKPKSQTPEGTEAPAMVQKYKFKLKDGDVEEEVEMDEEEVRRELMKSRSAYKRFEEAKSKEDAITQFMNNFKQDPWAVFNHLGVDPVARAEELLDKRYRQEMMTPEERAYYDQQDELARYRAQEQAQREEQERNQYHQTVEQKRNAISQNLEKAIGKVDLPKDPTLKTQVILDAVKFVAAEKAKLWAMEVYDVEPDYDKCLARAIRSYEKGVENYLKRLDIKTIKNKLGDEIIKKWREDDLANIKQVPTNKPSAGMSPITRDKTEDKAKPKFNERDWLRNVGKNLG